ncbi:Ty3/gypsy retrotransposon protein [Cucumis melo var. makuwa]|uniref:Ty3/gypsy retrotransposon protein n=1 Tax=Cucumis melo var. makuwa TaxID=1194695 RepID=A0A5A7TP54_CUCMM|nr:Ty3/gypsy retrotransposon protein [Cucumis melo var. makuwa]TYK25270.1 Ty3/gypsy retrotransposon protein [Cucumis melo var. makuwa]
MNGLNPWLKSEVETLEPIGLSQMMKLALKIENRELIQRECGLVSTYDTQPNHKNPQPLKGKEQSKNVAPTSVKELVTAGNWPMQTITLREVAAGDNRRDGPTKRLTDGEFQARRVKGLCFRCGEKYFAGHRCKTRENKEFRMLLVKEGGEELKIVEEEYFDAETEIKQVEGKIGKEEVVILIDCGATHNFIAEKLVTKLELIPQETPNYGVNDSFLPLELRGVDIILGMQWLYSLGVTEVDWKNLLLSFCHQGRKITIRGDPSLTKTRVSLKNLVKSWETDDQGFLVECRAMEGGPMGETTQEDEERVAVEAPLAALTEKFASVFEWPEKLPPSAA